MGAGLCVTVFLVAQCKLLLGKTVIIFSIFLPVYQVRDLHTVIQSRK
jgi:hypothetical protein